MMCGGVRALLVVRNDVVTGLITSYDIQGEGPLQFLATAGCSRDDEITVGHIMTPWERVPTIDWQTVSGARVSDIEAFFRHSPATRAVLVEPAGQADVRARSCVACPARAPVGARDLAREDRREAQKR
jgi:hypothetical protein